MGATAGQLAWRCRRGMKELDLLLAGWLSRRQPLASPAECAAFEALLDLTDPELARYLLDGEPPSADSPFAAVVAAVRNPFTPQPL